MSGTGAHLGPESVLTMVRYTQKLRLSGLLQSLELRCREAADANLPLTEFLYRLLADEVERRDGKQLDVRLRRAAFERPSTLEDFDFSFNVSVPRTQVLELGTCTFVERHENVLVVGPAGVGKSHLAQALGQRACRAGHAVLYVSAHDMLTQLRASRADNSYERRLLRFTTPALLIIDDLGLRPLTGEEGIDMYEIVRRRYERVADFNADGRLDVAATIAAANTVSLFPGLGDGSLSERA